MQAQFTPRTCHTMSALGQKQTASAQCGISSAEGGSNLWGVRPGPMWQLSSHKSVFFFVLFIEIWLKPAS